MDVQIVSKNQKEKLKMPAKVTSKAVNTVKPKTNTAIKPNVVISKVAVAQKNVKTPLINNVKPKSVEVEGDSKKVVRHRKPNFGIYISRSLKRVNPKISIGKKTLFAINSVLISLASRISNDVHNFIKTKTITPFEVESVVKFLMVGELCNHAVAYATKAVADFVASKEQPGKMDHRKRANITFSPGVAEGFLRQFGKTQVRVGTNAGVYLAAILEYLCEQVLESAAQCAIDDKHIRLKPRHLLIAVKKDADLCELLFSQLQIVIPEGGVIPNIHPALTSDASTKKRRVTCVVKTFDGKLKRRYAPGNLALKNIRKQQKASDLQIQHAPFRRECKKIAQELFGESIVPRFSSEFLEVLQQFVESRIVAWFEGAVGLALHGGRQTVAAKDLNAFISITDPSLYQHHATPDTVDFSIEGIRRLSYRAGVKMISAETFVQVKKYLHAFLKSHFIILAQMLVRDKKKTFDSNHIKQALSMAGVNIAV